MERVSILLFLSCSLVAAIHAGDLQTCARNYKRVGCFAEKGDQSSNMLIYDRYGIQWKNIKAYMHSLACKCEKAARNSKKYAGFAIHFWGECYGKTQAQIDAVNGKTQSLECTGDQKYDGCAADAKECAGHAYTDFVYELKSPGSIEKTFCNDSKGFLECNKDEKIEIAGISYWPRTADQCGDPITKNWEAKCSIFSSFDLEVYRGACAVGSRCDITGWSKPFNDPCKGTQKYLKVQYSCRA